MDKEGERECMPGYVNVPWAELISLCIDFKLDLIDYKDHHAQHGQVNLHL